MKLSSKRLWPHFVYLWPRAHGFISYLQTSTSIPYLGLAGYMPFLTLWILHPNGKVLIDNDCDIDPFIYFNINRTRIQSTSQSRPASNEILAEFAQTIQRWMPVCYEDATASRATDINKIFKDADDRTAAEIPPKKALTKLDQRLLEDLILQASAAVSVPSSDAVLRQKRSLNGSFTVSTYLRAADSPYEVTSDLHIPEGVTVNIEKGVEFRFRAGLGLIIRGRLVARGTRDDPILLQPLTEGSRWKGLTFETVFKAYDLRMTGGQGRADGYLETYDGHAWRLVCFQGWTRANSVVACKQLGFEQGASPELPTLTAEPLSKSYWLSNVDCSGSEKSLKDCRSQQTTACQRPTTLRCIGDVSENMTQKVDASILEYVNCSETETGIVVRSTAISAVPTLNFVTSQNSLNHGLWIDTFYTPDAVQGPHLYKCLWVNNRVTGFFLQLRYPTKDPALTFLIEESLATVGGGDGIRIEGRGNVHIIRSAAFGNAHNGIDIKLDAGSVSLDELILGANSGNGLLVTRGTTSSSVANDRLSVSLSNSKFTGHWAEPAAIFDSAISPANCDYTIERNEFWENYNGCISFPSAVTKSSANIVGNNFTRNRGPVVQFADMQVDTKLQLESNVFHLNFLSNHSDRAQAVVWMGLDAKDSSGLSTLQVIGNRFSKNTMRECVSVQPLSSNTRTSCALTMQGNWLSDNLVTTTVFLDIASANITQNSFSNPVSECELRTGATRNGTRFDARNNFWGASDEAAIRRKICDGTRDQSLAIADIKPWAQAPNVELESADRPLASDTSSRPGFRKEDSVASLVTSASAAVVDNAPSVAENYEIVGNGKPYSVAQNLVVSPKSTLTISPGAVLEFEADRGLRVQGTLIAKGTEDEPIVFRAAVGRTWNGVVFDNKNSPTSVLEHCIIDGARIGLSLNSDKLAIHRCIISNTVLNGITLTDDSGDKIDFGDSTILNAQDIGLRIANRYRSVDVRNFNVENTGGNGIDFDQPLVNASFSNCRLSNSRRYALHVDQMMSSRQSLAIQNCTVVNQNGVGGVILVARDYGHVSISNTMFSNNNARSLIVDLKCNFSGDMAPGQPSRFELIDSRFEKDNDNVVDIHLAYCSNAEIARNTFLSNNRDYRYGVFHLQLDPLKRPSSNGGKENFDVEVKDNLFHQNAGEFSAYVLPMSMADFVGVVSGNRFVDNENRRSVLVVGSPVFQVKQNEFDNRRSTYNLEAEYNDAKLMDATNNYWGTIRENEIHDTIFDGTKIPYRGTVKFIPYLTKSLGNSSTNVSSCDKRANCRGNGECVGDQTCACLPGYFGDDCEQVTCRELNDCSKNGRCVGPNRCECFNGWAGSDCRSPLCLGLANCSSHGECVSLNECQCETGWSGPDCSVQQNGGQSGSNVNGSNGIVGGHLSRNTSNGQGANINVIGNASVAAGNSSGHSGAVLAQPGTSFANGSGLIGPGNEFGTNVSNAPAETNRAGGTVPAVHVGSNGTNSTSGGIRPNETIGNSFGTNGNSGGVRKDSNTISGSGTNNTSGSRTQNGNSTGSSSGLSNGELPGINAINNGISSQGNITKGGTIGLNNGNVNAGEHGTNSRPGTTNNTRSINGPGTVVGQAVDTGQDVGAETVGINPTNIGGTNGTGGSSSGSSSTGANAIRTNGGSGTQCPNQCSSHGRCLQGNGCECETGWSGSNCGSPDCSSLRNCSGHGSCVGPNRCQCEKGYAGNNCAICIKNSTTDVCRVEEEVVTPPTRTIRSIATYSTFPPTTASTVPTLECNDICEHGFCDTRIGECQCYAPWTGINCDQCSRPTCADAPIRFISPDSAPAGMTAVLAAELFVRIVGSNFTKPLTNRYVCRYGDAVTLGVWLSSTDVECNVPPNQPTASLNFSMAPLDDSEADVGSLVNDTARGWTPAPTPFTFYATCGGVACGENSFCFRGSCYCSAGGSGPTEPGGCEEIQTAKPGIDPDSLHAFTFGHTQELQPTSVQLKTKNQGYPVRWVLAEGPIGAIINAANGLLTWAQPRGSSDATKFTVSAHTPSGADSISWSVAVPMTYQPVIDRFLNRTNGTYAIQGHVILLSNVTSGRSVPVELNVYKNGQHFEEWETWTDTGGKFESAYTTPVGDGGQFAITAVHPGNNTGKAEGILAPGTVEWAVQALRILPQDQVVQYDQRERAVVLATVENLGTAELHIIQISSTTLPPSLLNVSEITVAGTNRRVSSSYALQPQSNTTLSIALTIFGSVPEDKPLYFEVMTKQGASGHFSVKLKRSAPGPWLSADPVSLRYALVFDDPWPVPTVKVTNDGRATARNLIVQLNSETFIDVVNVFKNGVSIINNRTFDLAPGESIILALTIAPPAGLLGTGNADLTGRAYSGNVTVDFVSKEPTLYPLVIPYWIEFRTSSMIDRYNVTVVTEASGASKQPSIATGTAGQVPVSGAAVGLSNPFLARNKTTYTDGNGAALFTNVPEGQYFLSVEKTGYIPFRRVFKISWEQTANYKVVLEDYFSSTGQPSDANIQLAPMPTTDGRGGFQLQSPANAAPAGVLNGSSPYLDLNPSDLALHLNNITKSDKTITVRNLGGTTAIGFSMGVNDSRLPVTIESETIDVPVGETRVLRLSVKPNQGYIAPPADRSCDAYLVQLYYSYQTAQSNGTKRVGLLIKNQDGYGTNDVRLCQIDPTVSITPSNAIGLSVPVSCECRSSVMRQCLASYTEPLAVCGPGFSLVGNSSTDLSVFLHVVAALATCNAAKLNLDKGKEAVGCLVNMQDACSGTRKIWRSRWRRDAAEETGTTRFFDQLHLANSVSDRLGHPFGHLFPFLMRDAVQGQITETLKYFDRWFSYVAQVLGTSTLHVPTDPWYHEFTRSISDASEAGEAISNREVSKILSTLTSNYVQQRSAVAYLLERWNTTVSRGRRRPTAAAGQVETSGVVQSENVVSYATLHDLTTLTNVLNALAASQGFSTNFLSLLDHEIDNLRSTLLEKEGAASCLAALIKIDPVDVDEGDRLTLQFALRNLLNATSVQINELTPHFRPVNPDDNGIINFGKADPKYPGTVMDPAIGQDYAYWNVETELKQRLTKAVTFRVDLLIVFTQTGLRTQTQTKIQSLPFTVRPRASLRVLYFLYAPIPATVTIGIGRQRRRPNVMIALMNNGFRDLANVSISDTEIKVIANSERGPPVSFRLDYVLVEGNEMSTSFDIRIPSLRSGEVKYIQYFLSSPAAGNAHLDAFRASVFVNGEFLRSMSQEMFHILQWLNGSAGGAPRPDTAAIADSTPSNLLLGINAANGVQPAYLYNARTTLLAPINEAELVGQSEGVVTVNDRSYFHMRLQYRQNIQASRPGALYGEYGLSSNFNDSNDLLSGFRSNVSLDPSHMWLSSGGGDDEESGIGKVLNFVDPLTPNNQELLTYEFIFGPVNTGPPAFSQRSSFIIKVPSPASDVKVGTVLGTVSATDPDGGNVTYGLYGGDGNFAINPKTGEIKVARAPLPGDVRRTCLNVKVTDDGYPPKATFSPVEVVYEVLDNHVTQGPCGMLLNIDLLPNNLEKGTGGFSSTRGPFAITVEFATITHPVITTPKVPRESRESSAPQSAASSIRPTTRGIINTGETAPTSEHGEAIETTFTAETQAVTTTGGHGTGAIATTLAEEPVESQEETEVNEDTTNIVSTGRTIAPETVGTLTSRTQALSSPERTSLSTVYGAVTSEGASIESSETTSVSTGSFGSPGVASVASEQSPVSTVSGSTAGSPGSQSSVGPRSSVTATERGPSFTEFPIETTGTPFGSPLSSAWSPSTSSVQSPNTLATAGPNRSASTSGPSSTMPVSRPRSQDSSPIGVAQNEDGSIVEEIETTSRSPVANSALPAQAITPSFLPPDLLKGLGSDINVTSLTTDDLVMLACKLRGAQPIKPIWGIICDLGKAGGGGTTNKPSSIGQRLLDQIG